MIDIERIARQIREGAAGFGRVAAPTMRQAKEGIERAAVDMGRRGARILRQHRRTPLDSVVPQDRLDSEHHDSDGEEG